MSVCRLQQVTREGGDDDERQFVHLSLPDEKREREKSVDQFQSVQ